MKFKTNILSLCLWTILAIMTYTLASCSGSDEMDSDFTGIWREDYSVLYVDGVKAKTIKEPYTEFLNGGLGYGCIEISEDGYPYRNRARLYHQFNTGSTVTTYGVGKDGKSMMEANSEYSYEESAKLLIINDSQFEILDKNANSFSVKEESGKSLVGILRESDAYIGDLNRNEGKCYIVTYYKRVPKLGK